MNGNGKLIRRSQVMEMLGVSRWGMDKLVESGTLTAIPPIYPGARAHYRRSDVEKMTANNANEERNMR